MFMRCMGVWNIEISIVVSHMFSSSFTEGEQAAKRHYHQTGARER